MCVIYNEYTHVCVCAKHVQFSRMGNIHPTPYSMNSLFSELFREFGGAFLEVCETISKGLGEVCRGTIEDNYPEKNNRNMKIPIRYYKILFKIAPNSLFNE